MTLAQTKDCDSLSELRLLREGDPAAAGGLRVPQKDDRIQGWLVMAKIFIHSTFCERRRYILSTDWR